MSISLETNRLRFSPFSIDQLFALHQLFTHPFIRQYLWDDIVSPLEQTKEVLQSNEQFFN